MIQLSDGMLLYHGSYCAVSAPDLSKCAKYKDFGQGFYLTSSPEQAESFVRLSVKKAIARGLVDQNDLCGYVSVFAYQGDTDQLKIQAYETADRDWLHCVVGHRKTDIFSDYIESLRMCDMISGKIANDDTNATITTYMAGGYGPMGSEDADRICISLLLPERLNDQFCFRTEEALKHLSFVKSEEKPL